MNTTENDEELVIALAEALRTEYRAIVDAGFPAATGRCSRRLVTYDKNGAAGELR